MTYYAATLVTPLLGCLVSGAATRSHCTCSHRLLGPSAAQLPSLLLLLLLVPLLMMLPVILSVKVLAPCMLMSSSSSTCTCTQGRCLLLHMARQLEAAQQQ
jgi:hypothetical protein